MSVFRSHPLSVLCNGSLSRLRHLGIKIMALTQYIILRILPSQAQPCLIKPTIRDVHRWHLVGAVKEVRKNWWVLIYKAKRPNTPWRLNNLEKVILVIHSNRPVENIILYTKKCYSLLSYQHLRFLPLECLENLEQEEEEGEEEEEELFHWWSNVHKCYLKPNE